MLLFAAEGQDPPLFFWRDHSGHEVDVLVEYGGRVVPVEIKSGATIAADFFSGLNFWLHLPGNVERRGMLVYGGDEPPHRRSGHAVRPWFACS
jgi:hypothetical protein